MQFSYRKFIRLFGRDKGVVHKVGEFSNWLQGMLQRIQLQNVEREVSKDCFCCVSQYECSLLFGDLRVYYQAKCHSYGF